MKIIVDNREHALYDRLSAQIDSLSRPSFAILEKAILPLGDIIIQTDEGKNVMLIERKTYTDLLASIKDGRYEEQSYRLIHSSGFPLHSVVYLLEGMLSQIRTPLERKIVYSATTSLHYFKGFSVYKTATVDETAEWLIYTADKIEREFGKGHIPYYLTSTFAGNLKLRDDQTEPVSDTKPANYCSVVKKVKKENITPDNIGEIILCQIPGISSLTATAIMNKFTSFYHLITELQSNPLCIDNMTVTTNGKTRKINKTSLENIRTFLLYTKPTDATIVD